MLETSFPFALRSTVSSFVRQSLPKTVHGGTSFFHNPLASIRRFLSLVNTRVSKDISRMIQVLVVLSRHGEFFHIRLENDRLAVENSTSNSPDYLQHAKVLIRAAESVGGTMLIPASQSSRGRYIFHPTG